MRYLLLICCILKVILVSAQATGKSLINTVWENASENYIYSVYYQDNIYEITDYTKTNFPEGGITITIKIYGFYDNCDLPNLDSLKQEGTYYFEVDSIDFADEATTKVNMQNICGQLNVFREGTDTVMNIYYSSNQQYVTKKKVNALPENVRNYLKRKEIKFTK
ncbi:MAG: hypothetical protein ABI315_09025 [Bacteroidia bacterium]